MAQLIDSQTCDSHLAGWNPKLHIGQRGHKRLMPYTYKVFIPFTGGLELTFQSPYRKKAIHFFLENPDAVIRMEMSCSEICIGLAINNSSGVCELPLEQA